MTKRLLVIGNGGREHALCWKLSQSEQVSHIFCAPGNAGTAQTLKTKNVDIAVSDFEGLVQFAKAEAIDLVVVGPDNPLAGGIVDVFQEKGLRVFGPCQAAAALESSKAFAKAFMKTHGLPTARFGVFDKKVDAVAFCEGNAWARVIKVDGLALGKGVYVCETLADCEMALSEIFDAQRFGESGAKVVVEERLVGPEISLMTLYDGKTLLPLASSQDYKRRFEGNKGPNTGGMGVYSPVPLYDDYEERIQSSILTPLSQALAKAPFQFKGVLYVGLMFQEGQPYILEFNARFGDPETQCLLPRLSNDFCEVLEAVVDETLDTQVLNWIDEVTVCVVLTADTYPEKGSTGEVIQMTSLPKGVEVFHAGTRLAANGTLETNGGRVLNVVAKAVTFEMARQKAYDAIQCIDFESMAYREDIAEDVEGLCLLTSR